MSAQIRIDSKFGNDKSSYKIKKIENGPNNNLYLTKYSKEKPYIIMKNENNYIYLKNENDFNNNLITEASKINLIKNPPNLCINDDKDENLKIYNKFIKLSSELTLEKTKVIKLTSLLRDKENDNINLKQKIKELEKNYKELQKDQKEYCEDIYKEASLDKNSLRETYEEIQRIKDKELSKISKEINNFYNIINLFFDFYNKKINFLKKTGIISKKESNYISLENNHNINYKNSLNIINSLEELIGKLINDNQILYNELINYKNIAEKYELFRKNEEKQDENDEKRRINNEKYDDNIDWDNENKNFNKYYQKDT